MHYTKHNLILYGKLQEFNISSKFIYLNKNTYSQLKCQVRTTEGMSECFSQDNGVLQGESLSPTLFAAYINELESRMNSIEGMGVNINGVKASVLMYYSFFTENNLKLINSIPKKNSAFCMKTSYFMNK